MIPPPSQVLKSHAEAEPDIEEGAIHEGNTRNGEAGEWYVVEYDNKLYPGEVKEIGELGDYRVSVMHGAKDNSGNSRTPGMAKLSIDEAR